MYTTGTQQRPPAQRLTATADFIPSGGHSNFSFIPRECEGYPGMAVMPWVYPVVSQDLGQGLYVTQVTGPRQCVTNIGGPWGKEDEWQVLEESSIQGASLVAQWLRLRLPVQGTRV